MIRRILFALSLAAIAAAQTPTVARTNIGNLKCGALKRSANTVQTYCYAVSPELVLVHNTIDTVKGVLEVRSNYENDAIHWFFAQTDQGIEYMALAGAGVPEVLANLWEHYGTVKEITPDEPVMVVYNQPEGCSATGEWRPADQAQLGPSTWAVVFYRSVQKGVL